MAGRSKYDQATKARLYVALKANGDNLKKTAREQNFPVATLRNWRDDWVRGLNIPNQDVLEVAHSTFLKDVEQARDRAVELISQGLDGLDAANLSMNDLKGLAVIVGILDDKYSRGMGLDRDKNLHVHHHLPTADELRGLMGTFVQEQIEAADIELDDSEVRLLPA